jgi:hypothetical protein
MGLSSECIAEKRPWIFNKPDVTHSLRFSRIKERFQVCKRFLLASAWGALAFCTALCFPLHERLLPYLEREQCWRD